MEENSESSDGLPFEIISGGQEGSLASEQGVLCHMPEGQYRDSGRSTSLVCTSPPYFQIDIGGYRAECLAIALWGILRSDHLLWNDWVAGMEP